MATLLHTVGRWFGWGGALGESKGDQHATPTEVLNDGLRNIGAEGALQMDTVWAAIDRRATTVASLPFFVYEQRNGQKVLARTSRLYILLHDSPNSRMTPFEFWRAMMMNYDLRGNAYARVERAPDGEAVALWPMPADQVIPVVLDDGSMVYRYYINGDIAFLSDENVLHLKNLGNGTVGLAKLEFMRGTTDEQAKAQQSASKVFGNGGKPTGVLMIDATLKPGQRESLRANYGELATGSTSRLAVLEANMKYQQLGLSPEDQQLLETRQFGVEQFCRWLDVPPVLVYHSNVTAWGTGIEQIVDGWHKFSLRPILVGIEQAVRKRVMTPRQRATMTAEFSLDALLRGNAKDRTEIAAKKVQNGLATRNEMRQLENEPPIDGGDVITVQTNLLPIDKLGMVPTKGTSNADSENPVAQ